MSALAFVIGFFETSGSLALSGLFCTGVNCARDSRLQWRRGGMGTDHGKGTRERETEVKGLASGAFVLFRRISLSSKSRKLLDETFRLAESSRLSPPPSLLRERLPPFHPPSFRFHPRPFFYSFEPSVSDVAYTIPSLTMLNPG